MEPDRERRKGFVEQMEQSEVKGWGMVIVKTGTVVIWYVQDQVNHKIRLKDEGGSRLHSISDAYWRQRLVICNYIDEAKAIKQDED